MVQMQNPPSPPGPRPPPPPAPPPKDRQCNCGPCRAERVLTEILPFEGAAPTPWNWLSTQAASNNGACHLYIVDANGRKIAAIWGKGDEKVKTAELIIAAVNGGMK